MGIRTLLLFLLSFGASASGQFDQDLLGEETNTPPATAGIVSEVSEIAPGEPFRVALKITHAPHWHTYYVNPGQAGFPPSIDWDLPEGFTAGDLEFPTPILGAFAGAPFYGYEGETWFLQTITPPATLRPGETITLSGEASWLACNETCIPGDAELQLELPVGSSASPNPDTAASFARADAAMPLARTPWTIEATATGETVTLTLTPGAQSISDPGAIHLFSSNSIEDSAQAQRLSKDDDAWKLVIHRNPETDPQPAEISGILKAENGWISGNPSLGLALQNLPIGAPAAADSTASSPEEKPALPLILGLMFLGGLILNLMPCVFPVIGLKIMGFVQQSGHDRKKIVSHGLLFTAGVLVSFWILAGILLAGGIRNWGGQLEDPWVVYLLLLVMLVFGLSMYGVFEIGASATGVGSKLSNRQGLSGTFFSGVLATVVATPCSAPFLGTGLGAAVALPPLPFMLAFTFMALGLSLPYLVLSFAPSLVDKLPRPGPWMESFKQGMSFLLFGTAGFLLWVYSLQVFDQKGGQKGLWVVLGLTAIAAGFWIYGRWTLPYRALKVRTAGRIAAVAFVVAGFVAAKPSPDAVISDNTVTIVWQDWTKEKQDALLAEGRSVYVDFTARWCLTCQTNKAAAYPEEVARLFQDRGIVALRADKTTARPDIDEELRRLGRSAIPVNVLYANGDSTPHITNTLLTADYMKEFISSKVPPPQE